MNYLANIFFSGGKYYYYFKFKTDMPATLSSF